MNLIISMSNGDTHRLYDANETDESKMMDTRPGWNYIRTKYANTIAIQRSHIVSIEREGE